MIDKSDQMKYYEIDLMKHRDFAKTRNINTESNII